MVLTGVIQNLQEDSNVNALQVRSEWRCGHCRWRCDLCRLRCDLCSMNCDHYCWRRLTSTSLTTLGWSSFLRMAISWWTLSRGPLAWGGPSGASLAPRGGGRPGQEKHHRQAGKSDYRSFQGQCESYMKARPEVS